MIKTTYTCDHCKQEKERNDLYEIKLTALSIAGSDGFPLQPACGPAHYCVGCMRDSGWFLPDRMKAESPSNPAPATIDQLIRGMIEDCLEQQTTDR